MATGNDSAPGDVRCAGGFVLKVAELCNLNCSYCYMYHKGDTSFRQRPRFMSQEVAASAIRRIAAYALRHQLAGIELALHGGEPLLVGRSWVKWFFEEALRIGSANGVTFTFALQTNGTLLDNDWVELLSQFNVRVGVSCDGPEQLHDLARRDHAGRGSYAKVRRALELLRDHYRPRWGVLAVANPEISGKLVLQHFAEIGVPTLDFLWPDYNHNYPPPWPPGVLARYYIEIFDFWYDELASTPGIRWFETAINLLLGGSSSLDSLGPNPITDVMIESNGSWEPLDVLRTCKNGLTLTTINVLTDDVERIWDVPLYRIALHNQELLPPVCKSCPFRNVCGGGYIPHRYSREDGFSNPSVHCADLFAVLAHIRERITFDLQQLKLIQAR